MTQDPGWDVQFSRTLLGLPGINYLLDGDLLGLGRLRLGQMERQHAAVNIASARSLRPIKKDGSLI